MLHITKKFLKLYNKIQIFRWEEVCPKCGGILKCSGGSIGTEYSAECSKCKKHFHKADTPTYFKNFEPLDWIEH